MHKSFVDWYRAAGVEPSTDLLTNRWTAIEAFIEAPTTGTVLDTIRLFHGLSSRSAGFDEAFRKPFKAADAAFAMHGNDLEVSFWAESVAGAVIEQGGGRRADVAALAMLCADYSGSRRMESFPFFVDRVRQYLLERSAALRAMTREVELNAPDLWRATKRYLVTYTPEGRIELQPRGRRCGPRSRQPIRRRWTRPRTSASCARCSRQIAPSWRTTSLRISVRRRSRPYWPGWRRATPCRVDSTRPGSACLTASPRSFSARWSVRVPCILGRSL